MSSIPFDLIHRPDSPSNRVVILQKVEYHQTLLLSQNDPMSKHLLRIATRQSPLAMWQAHHIKEALERIWEDLTVELCPFVTSGDKFLKDTLQEKGGKGLFVKELEEALLDHRADLAVHSMKDVPAHQPPGLCIATICQRANPFDALISTKYAGIDDLPESATIGTSSLRRQSQLLRLRPDLNIATLRGNIQTRLEKLNTEGFDAIILARAGLERMGLSHLITETLSPERMLPACGQGALALECRIDDKDTLALIAPLHHHKTAQCIEAERIVNKRLGGHCHVPIAIFCEQRHPDSLSLKARVLSNDGNQMIEAQRQGLAIEFATIANQVADDLLQNGAHALLSTPHDNNPH